MKTVLLIRHAKSSWANAGQSDFERPLNERGEKDAPEMGERLKKIGIKPDLIISSAAKRTQQTAKKIADALNYKKDDIQWEEKLYHCAPHIFEEIISGVKDKIETIFIVAHNPGITAFANMLCDGFRVDNMPTCSVVGAHVETEHWSEFIKAKKKVFLFERP